MKYENVQKAVFLERPNRFIARVRLENGSEETVHVKNTGRCGELLIPGAEVWLSEGGSPKRKTKYDLISVRKQNPSILVNLDSQACNQVMKEWLQKEYPDWIIQPEKTARESRLDFHLTKENESLWIEVKGCSLEENGTGFFPDAPSLRATRHLQTLVSLQQEGHQCAAAFVIQAQGIRKVLPNYRTDPDFAQALLDAAKAGVQIWFCSCTVKADQFEIANTDRLGASFLLKPAVCSMLENEIKEKKGT